MFNLTLYIEGIQGGMNFFWSDNNNLIQQLAKITEARSLTIAEHKKVIIKDEYGHELYISNVDKIITYISIDMDKDIALQIELGINKQRAEQRFKNASALQPQLQLNSN